jgi:hypothetical protein
MEMVTKAGLSVFSDHLDNVSLFQYALGRSRLAYLTVIGDS